MLKESFVPLPCHVLLTFHFFMKLNCNATTLDSSLICIFLSGSHDVHFDKRIVMHLKWSIVKSTSEQKIPRKLYHLKDTALVCDFCEDVNPLCT